MIQNSRNRKRKQGHCKRSGTLDLTDIQVTDATVFEITAVGIRIILLLLTKKQKIHLN